MIYAPPVKRSVTVAGHATSVTLEPTFWAALERAAVVDGVPISALVARVDAARLEAAHPPNLASALRAWLLHRACSGDLHPSRTSGVSAYRAEDGGETV